MNEVLTVKIRGGMWEVLAKQTKYGPTAVTYANLSQARRRLDQLGPGWAIYGHYPFYVGRVKGGAA